MHPFSGTVPYSSLGPAIARATSTYEMAGNQEVALGDTKAALDKSIVTSSSLDSYDSAVEDAQRRVPKRTKETFVTPQKPLPAAAEPGVPRPSKAAKQTSPPAAKAPKAPSPKPTAGPTRLNSQESSPGPSASDVAPPAPGTKGKRSKSPTYWRTQNLSTCIVYDHRIQTIPKP